MEEFQVSPEYCLILRALSRTQSLREAAKILECDPASLVRKVKTISSTLGLLQKTGGRWILTDSGNRAVQWLEQGIATQKAMLLERPRKRIAAPGWLAEQVLIPALNRLQTNTQHQALWGIHTTPIDFERELISGKVEYVIVCRPPTDPSIAHRRALIERWILIAPHSWKKEMMRLSFQDRIQALQERPFIRHASLNPEASLGFSVHPENQELIMDSLISIRAAVEAELGWSCVPELLVRSSLRENKCLDLQIPVQSKGELCLWWLRARRDLGKTIPALCTWLETSASPHK